MKAVCGLDVRKDSIYLCILRSDGELFEQVFGILTFLLEKVTTHALGVLSSYLRRKKKHDHQ